MSKILINQIWQHRGSTYRILYVNQDIDLVIWFNLDEYEKGFPEELAYCEFENLYESNAIEEIEHVDSYVDVNSIDEKTLKRYEQSWSIIEELVLDEPIIFDKKHFTKTCSQQASKTGVSRQKVQRLVKQYWYSGKTKMGIIPKYYNSGGKGKEKNFNSLINGRKRIDNKTPVILDENLKLKLKKGYKRWYLEVEQASTWTAYYNFIRNNYIKEWKSKSFKNIPSHTQFCYWGEKGISIEQKLRSKKGTIIFDKDLRTKEGSSSNSVNGPGLSQIDSTPSDMELVSEIDMQTPIGCPTIYIISDVYSAMFLGVLVTLENPSYIHASEALYNSFSNKGEFFERSLLYQYDNFKLSEKDWPTEYIPYSIVTDRGTEFIGENSNNIIDNLSIHIENKESYRPELKGIIENQFQLLHKRLKGLDDQIGMKSKNDGRRGARKARKSAQFTLREYLAIIVQMIVDYNKNHKLTEYPLDKEMPLDDYTLQPLWRYSIGG